MPDEVSAFTFRTWLRAGNAEEWVPGHRLLLYVDDGGNAAPQAVSWGTVDGAQSSLALSRDLASCSGHHVTAAGDVREIRDELQDRASDPLDVERAGGHEFDTETEGTAGWRPADRLRLLIDDGTELPLRRAAWRDRAGNAASVALRSPSPSGNADVTDMVTTVWASAEHRAADEVAANLVDGTHSTWFAPRNEASLEFRFPRPVVIDQYVFTSAGDAPDRDPRSWVVHGSTDGRLWRVLDSRGGESFADRHESRPYRIYVEPRAYDRYRFDIHASNGSPHLRLQDVRFLAQSSGFTGYRHPAGHDPVAYRGRRVAKEPPAVRMGPLPEGLPTVTESYSARDLARQRRAEPMSASGAGPRKESEGDETAPRPEPGPSTVTEWRAFLSDYGSTFPDADRLREAGSDGRGKHPLSQTQRETRRPGREPASEEAVLAAEARLGVRLPPAYRNFLLTSNGWTTIGRLDLLGAEEIGWFPDLDPGLLEAWESAGFPDVTRTLERSLLITNDDGGSGGHWLLDSGRVAEDGEWIAYEWWPGEGGDLEEHDNVGDLVARAVEASS
ncbi:SMI1/KNR4 family protein [Streptomyces sp. NPDC101249]|uniref:SMI1/KNR4 family protein n=1 Tax=Streptomyces sp. NPDC101249 TaxID=3366140 RepID=UPI003817052E